MKPRLKIVTSFPVFIWLNYVYLGLYMKSEVFWPVYERQTWIYLRETYNYFLCTPLPTRSLGSCDIPSALPWFAVAGLTSCYNLQLWVCPHSHADLEKRLILLASSAFLVLSQQIYAVSLGTCLLWGMLFKEEDNIMQQ